MTRPTFDEMRARLVWAGRYAAQPGTGPEGETCGDCESLVCRAGSPKCIKARALAAPVTIAISTPACRLFKARKR